MLYLHLRYNNISADQYWGEFFNIIAVPENEDPTTGADTNSKASIVIYTQGGMIYIEGVETDYNVFDASGRLIYTGRESTLALSRGVYMIVVGNKVEKIVL